MENINDELLKEVEFKKEIEEIKKDRQARKTKILSKEEFEKSKKNSELLYMAQLKRFAEFCQSGVCRIAEEEDNGEEN